MKYPSPLKKCVTKAPPGISASCVHCSPFVLSSSIRLPSHATWSPLFGEVHEYASARKAPSWVRSPKNPSMPGRSLGWSTCHGTTSPDGEDEGAEDSSGLGGVVG